MKTKFGDINSIERSQCEPTELYYRASDIDAFKGNCLRCDMAHSRKISEMEQMIEILKGYKYAFCMMLSAWIILLIAYILK